MRTSIYLEGKSEEAHNQMPRTVNFSAIVRWLLIASSTPEKEFLKMRDASEEGTRVADFLRGKIEKLTK